MDDGSKPPLIQLFILLCFSAYLAFTETAFASVSKNKIKIAAEHGDNRAKRALWALENIENALTTILICNNLTSLTIASIVTVYVTKKWGLSFVSLGTIVTTMVIFFACEMLPKTLAKRFSFPIALACSGLLGLLMHILKPFASVLTRIGEKAANRTREDEEISVTEDEIQEIIEDMAEEGTLDEDQSTLISSALQFGDLKAKNIVTPRMKIVAINADDEQEKILETVKNLHHSRIPVYDGTIDNIIGVLGIRNYLKTFIQTKKTPEVRKMLDKVYFANEETEIHELLQQMSKRRINMAVVKDAYGGTLGIVTVEDILEELVGEIYDENETVREGK